MGTSDLPPSSESGCEQELERVRSEVTDLADRIRKGHTWTGEAVYTALMIAIAPTPEEARRA